MHAKACFLLAASLALAGCGQEGRGDGNPDREPGLFAYDPQSGETVARIDTGEGIATMRSGENVPAVLPAGFTVFPGATVIDSTLVTRGSNAEGKEAGSGALVLFESTASPAEMAEFYRRQAVQAGIDPELELRAEGWHMIAGKSPGGVRFSFNASTDGEVTDAQLMVRKRLDR